MPFLVSICDTGAAILAGFVIIPSAFAGGVDMQSGPSLIFLVMTGIFSKLPGGRLIGICFFLAIVFAVISSLFTFFEISIRTFEDNLKMGRMQGNTYHFSDHRGRQHYRFSRIRSIKRHKTSMAGRFRYILSRTL